MRSEPERGPGDELDAPTPTDGGTDLSALGFLQRSIAGTPEMYTEQGATARRIMEVTCRHDEPNIRSSLDGMVRRGFAELVPGHTRPLRFRMTERFRRGGAACRIAARRGWAAG